jgi:fumarylacetoacetase
MDDDHFSVANIPFGIGTSTIHPKKSIVTRLENKVIFLEELCKAGLLPTLSETIVKTFSEV